MQYATRADVPPVTDYQEVTGLAGQGGENDAGIARWRLDLDVQAGWHPACRLLEGTLGQHP
jgi:hypothetical protein